MRQRRRAGQIVHGNKIDLGITECGTQHVAANAAEAVDANLNCHCVFSFVVSEAESSTEEAFGGLWDASEGNSTKPLIVPSGTALAKDAQKRFAPEPPVLSPIVLSSKGTM